TPREMYVAELDTTTGEWSDAVQLYGHSWAVVSARYLAGGRKVLVDVADCLVKQSMLVDLDAKTTDAFCDVKPAIVRPDGAVIAYPNGARWGPGGFFGLLPLDSGKSNVQPPSE